MAIPQSIFKYDVEISRFDAWARLHLHWSKYYFDAILQLQELSNFVQVDDCIPGTGY